MACVKACSRLAVLPLVDPLRRLALRPNVDVKMQGREGLLHPPVEPLHIHVILYSSQNYRCHLGEHRKITGNVPSLIMLQVNPYKSLCATTAI